MSVGPSTRWAGKFLRVIQSGPWEYVDRLSCNGAVAIMAITGNRELVLTEQFRIPVNARVVELPAGLAGDSPATAGEELEAAARRELLEETGFSARSMARLCSGPPSAGLASEIVTFFHATDLRRVGVAAGDGEEEITVHLVPLQGLRYWLEAKMREGLLVDPKIFAGLYLISPGEGSS